MVQGGSFYDGGGETIYLPGEYQYSASNNMTTSPVTSPVFRVEGMMC